MAVISAYQLFKQFKGKEVLSNFTLEIEEGEVFGLLGSEKSGKTTFLRILAGLLLPTGGECYVLGLSPKTDLPKLHAAVGVVTESAKLYRDMTVDENLRFYANLNNIDTDDAIDRISFLLHSLDVWEYRDQKPDALPTNAIQQVNTARALLHRPKVLLMDEPTTELNRETIEAMRGMIQYAAEQEGVTSLICTRHPDHAEKICSRFGILHEANLLAKGSFEQLRLSSGLEYEAQLRLAMDSLLPIGFEHRDGVWVRKIAREEDMPALIAEAAAHGCKLYEARISRPSLKEICGAYISGAYVEMKAGEENEASELPDAEERPEAEYEPEGGEGRDGGAPADQPEAGDFDEAGEE